MDGHSTGHRKASSVEATRAAVESAHKRTLSRLNRVHQHISDTPIGNRLQGKVAIITGVGSLKGIGCVNMADHWAVLNTEEDELFWIDVLQHSCLPIKVITDYFEITP